MNNKIFLVVVLTLSLVYVGVHADDEEQCLQCPQTPKHYAELGCKPITEEGQNCTTRFECPQITDLDGKKCHYEGKAYDVSEELPTEMTSGLCAAACRCTDRSEPATFNCANIECPHNFGPYNPKCKQLYSPNECCPSKTECDAAEIEKLATCQFENKEYRAGQRMYPETKEHSCYTCLCTENFDNSTVIGNPDCQEVNCGIQLRNFGRIQQGCIPIYYGTARCCPIGWRCPSEEDDTITPVSRSEITDEKMTCKFGDKTMRLGDILASANKCHTCKCQVPPMPHCVQNPKC